MGRHATRFVSITDQEREWLEDLWKHDSSHSTRCRAHAILLSSQHYSIVEISSICRVSYETIENWLDRFEQHRCDGLFDAPRSGRPPILDEKDRKIVRQVVEEHLMEPQVVLKTVQDKIKKTFSRETLRRALRAMGYRWKRLRLSLENRRDPVAFDFTADFLKLMEQLPDWKVVYFDESHFSVAGTVSYGWQELGRRTVIPVSGGARKSIQVLGFQSPDGEVQSYVQRKTIRGSTVAAAIEDFARTVKGKTLLVLDNASPHTCNEVQSHIRKWVSQGLYLHFLPPYSPELNRIEHTWQRIKHQLMPPTAWQTIDTLANSLLRVLKGLGPVKQLEPIAAV